MLAGTVTNLKCLLGLILFLVTIKFTASWWVTTSNADSGDSVWVSCLQLSRAAKIGIEVEFINGIRWV